MSHRSAAGSIYEFVGLMVKLDLIPTLYELDVILGPDNDVQVMRYGVTLGTSKKLNMDVEMGPHVPDPDPRYHTYVADVNGDELMEVIDEIYARHNQTQRLV